MKLRELENVIEDDATVFITCTSDDGLPLMFRSWKEFKKDCKKAAWEEEVTLRSSAGIEINFVNL